MDPNLRESRLRKDRCDRKYKRIGRLQNRDIEKQNKLLKEEDSDYDYLFIAPKKQFQIKY